MSVGGGPPAQMFASWTAPQLVVKDIREWSPQGKLLACEQAFAVSEALASTRKQDLVTNLMALCDDAARRQRVCVGRYTWLRGGASRWVETRAPEAVRTAVA